MQAFISIQNAVKVAYVIFASTKKLLLAKKINLNGEMAQLSCRSNAADIGSNHTGKTYVKMYL